MTFDLVILAALALLLLAAVSLGARRSLAGLLVAAQLGVGGLVLLACVLFDLGGTEPSTGQVIAAAVVVFGVVVAAVLIALHVAAARALRRPGNAEPW
jgi:hypothetical protein